MFLFLLLTRKSLGVTLTIERCGQIVFKVKRLLSVELWLSYFFEKFLHGEARYDHYDVSCDFLLDCNNKHLRKFWA